MRGAAKIIRDFGAGVQTAIPLGGYDSDRLPLDGVQAMDALNVRATKHGALRKRTGRVAKFSSGGTDLTSVAWVPGGLLVGGADGTLYSWAGGSVTVVGSYTPTGLWEWVTGPSAGAAVTAYGVNGNDALTYAGGVAAPWVATTGAIQTAHYLAYANSRMFLARLATTTGLTGVVDPGSAMAWSDPGNGQSWPVENWVEFDPLDGDRLTGIMPIGDQLLVTKQRKAFIVYDLESGAFRRLPVGTGSYGQRTFASTERGIYFASEQGLMRTDGSSVERLSPPWTDFLNGAWTRETPRCAAWLDERYIISFTNFVYDYDAARKAWWVHNFVGGHPNDYEVSAEDGKLYDVSSQTLYEAFVPNVYTDTDSEGGFGTVWVGPFLTFGSAEAQTRLRRVDIIGTGAVGFNLYDEHSTRLAFLPGQDIPGAIRGRLTLPTPGVSRIWQPTIGFGIYDTGLFAELPTTYASEVDEIVFRVQGRRG